MNEIKKVGIIGSGKMGSNLFNYLSDFNFELVWFTRNAEHKEILRNTYHKKIKRQLKHGILSKGIFDLRNQYRISDQLADLSECDLIIESVIEEPDVKFELFHKLDRMVKPSCVLASNSSSISPSEISEAVQLKNRIVGLHFFYPIAFKNVVELISSEFTDEMSIEKTKYFLTDIKRFYLEQNENDAFLLNRFLLQIQLAALDLLQEYKLGYQQFDELSKTIIPEFGLFEMMDHVGHNTMYNAILNYLRRDPEKKKYEALLKELKSRNKLPDQNASNLFYDQEPGFNDLSPKQQAEIVNNLKTTAENTVRKYSNEYQINIFNLKKGIEEFCGIML